MVHELPMTRETSKVLRKECADVRREEQLEFLVGVRVVVVVAVMYPRPQPKERKRQHLAFLPIDLCAALSAAVVSQHIHTTTTCIRVLDYCALCALWSSHGRVESPHHVAGAAHLIKTVGSGDEATKFKYVAHVEPPPCNNANEGRSLSRASSNETLTTEDDDGDSV
jgi:hypothetical protein